MRVTGYALRVASCGLRVAGCELGVAGCELRVVSWGLRVKKAKGMGQRACRRIRKSECGMRKKGLWVAGKKGVGQRAESKGHNVKLLFIPDKL